MSDVRLLPARAQSLQDMRITILLARALIESLASQGSTLCVQRVEVTNAHVTLYYEERSKQSEPL